MYWRIAAAMACLVALACVKPLGDPLQLDGGRVTVDNRTDHDWTDVQIWINRYFRMSVPKIQKGQRFQSQANLFVSGYGQRFDPGRIPINDLRVNARRPDGTTFELRKQFSSDPLSDVLKKMGGNQ